MGCFDDNLNNYITSLMSEEKDANIYVVEQV